MRKLFLILITILCGLSVSAQGVLNVRINEVLVRNDSDIIDDYGQRESWIEIFNTGYERVDIGGCYIGIRYADRFDGNGNKVIQKYYIPRNNPNTSIEPLGYRLFFCEGTGSKGTFYTNFRLGDEPVDMIILYSANGKDIISVFRFPDTYTPVPDQAWGIIGHDEIESKVFPKLTRAEKRALTSYDAYLDAIATGLKYQPRPMVQSTPLATNEINEEISHDELFRQQDPSGIVMTLIAMGVVFLALVAIFIIFKVFGMVMMKRSNRNSINNGGEAVVGKQAKNGGYTGEEVAAIAMALKMYQEDLHVRESSIITINNVSRKYSPWNSKIHGITELPMRKSHN